MFKNQLYKLDTPIISSISGSNTVEETGEIATEGTWVKAAEEAVTEGSVKVKAMTTTEVTATKEETTTVKQELVDATSAEAAATAVEYT